MTKVDTRSLKARIDIIDVLVKVGAVVNSIGFFDEEVRVFCPFCSDATSRKAAGRANPLKGLYHCWACGFGGDIFDVAGKYLEQKLAQSESLDDDLFGKYKSPFEESVAWIEDNFPFGKYKSPFEESVAWIEDNFPAEGGDDNPWKA